MKVLKTLSTGLALFGAVALQAQTFDQVAEQAEQDLLDAEKELASLRNSIADEKIPISQKLTQLENEVQTERKDYDRVVKAADNVDVDLSAMENKVKSFEDENVYLKNLLSSYIKAFNTRIHSAELNTYKAVIEKGEQTLEDANASDSDKLSAQIAVVQTSIERIKAIMGGHKFEGKALGKNGREVKGTYILAGPVAMFGDGGENVGFAQGEVNAAYPIVFNQGISPEVIATIGSITSGSGGLMPIDPSEGNAIKMALVEETLVEHIMKGGRTMFVLLGLAFVALCVAIFKIFEITSVKRPKAGQLQQILDNLNSGKKQQALEIANSVDGPFGDLLVAGVEHADQEKELLEEVLYERLLAAQPKLERMLAFIALTAGAAPLLGLLGTVTGMINTFKLITVFGTGDASSLSSGISEALITTEYGLIVAIPALLAQALLTRLAKGRLGEMEQASVAFVNGLANRK
ncbi:MotA/TolQ/ExbB proton channel family protein [Puniceicoccaceae bacterium K14]|nr:MotA/TolQ/ExbB proton channel family protein [Puniceicoccaceae bacterium K14]